MTDQERAAIDAAMNAWARDALTHVLVALTVIATLYLIWQKLNLPAIDLRPWFAPLVSRVSTWVEHLTVPATLPPNSTERAEPANERTNEPTRTPRTALYKAADLLLVDRTRPAVIAVLVAAGWKTSDIRDTLKGTAADIGQEVKAAQEAEPPPRTLVVDGKRTIAL
jgi:hypothetical protein